MDHLKDTEASFPTPLCPMLSSENKLRRFKLCRFSINTPVNPVRTMSKEPAKSTTFFLTISRLSFALRSRGAFAMRSKAALSHASFISPLRYAGSILGEQYNFNYSRLLELPVRLLKPRLRGSSWHGMHDGARLSEVVRGSERGRRGRPGRRRWVDKGLQMTLYVAMRHMPDHDSICLLEVYVR